ncbi:MAG: hypothetical protein VKN33_05720 [Candidatus Sericytochromatia bacterium]|nr:hypothetical protein [Candidatus Sericytochromatia bacterium]
MKIRIAGNPNHEQAAVIVSVVSQMLEEAQHNSYSAVPAQKLSGWQMASRVEHLGIVRRIPGILDLRYMGAPTRERLQRGQHQGSTGL